MRASTVLFAVLPADEDIGWIGRATVQNARADPRNVEQSGAPAAPMYLASNGSLLESEGLAFVK